MPDQNTNMALQQLRKLAQTPGTAPVNTQQAQQLGSQVGSAVANSPLAAPRQPMADINLPADDQENSVMRLLRLLRQGTLFGVKEQKQDPNAIVYQGDGRGGSNIVSGGY